MSDRSAKNRSGNSQLLLLVSVAIIGLVIGVFILLRKENQKTRETLEKIGPETVQEGVKEAKKTAKEIPSVILNEMLDIIGSGTDDKGSNKQNTPKDIVTGVFDLGREVIKTTEDVIQQVIGLGDDEENELGESVHKQVLKAHKVVNSPAKQQRIEKLAEPLLAIRERKGIPYTFTIVKDDSVNAFALPGGYIYLHTGLLNFVTNDAELQYVLGHEIGHVDLKHCANSFTLAVRAAQVTGGLATIPVSQLYNLYALQFSENDEFEADKYGFIRMRKIGHSREASLSFERHMIEHHKSLGITTSKDNSTSIPEILANEFHNHFRTHPPTEERLKALEELEIPGIDNQTQ